MVCLVYTKYINPKIFQAVLYSLFPTESDPPVAGLALASANVYVVESDHFGVCSPRMAKYRIGGNGTLVELP